MSLRKALFWMHLIAGCVAGSIILVMSVTGVLLTYERQILVRADRSQYQSTVPPVGAIRLSVDQLLACIDDQQGSLPRDASLILRSNPAEPVEINLGREGALYASPYDGRILGRSNQEARRVFQRITAWHRWLGQEGEGRATAKVITGTCNFAFLFIVLSGMYLWLPKIWSRQHLRAITWFKGGLSGKARDYNWHNVFGFWMAIPLAIVVASAVPMSFTWANNLLYSMTGSEIPAPNRPRDGGVAGKRGDSKGMGKRRAAEPQKEGLQATESRSDISRRPSLNVLWTRAERQVPGWRSISMRLPDGPSADVAFVIDTGNGGQPQKRSTLTLDLVSGAVKKWEAFSSNSAGRRLRTWSRFAHTGEYYGVIGQTVAGIASLAGVLLVWTGISLALRRLSSWRARRSRQSIMVQA